MDRTSLGFLDRIIMNGQSAPECQVAVGGDGILQTNGGSATEGWERGAGGVSTMRKGARGMVPGLTCAGGPTIPKRRYENDN